MLAWPTRNTSTFLLLPKRKELYSRQRNCHIHTPKWMRHAEMKGITPDFSSFEILTITALPLTHYRNSQRLLVPTKILKVFLFLPKEQSSFQTEKQNPNFSTEECLRSLCPTCDLYLASRTSKISPSPDYTIPSDQKKYHTRIEVNATNKNEPKPLFLTFTCAYDRFENFAPTLRPAKCLPTPTNPNLRLEISL